MTRRSCHLAAVKSSSCPACACSAVGRVSRTQLSSTSRPNAACATASNFGPIRDDVSPTVQYNLTDAPMGVPDSEIAEYGGTLFTAVGCEVTVVHTEIRCKSFPGFASR